MTTVQAGTILVEQESPCMAEVLALGMLSKVIQWTAIAAQPKPRLSIASITDRPPESELL